jgi:hypothetical protein
MESLTVDMHNMVYEDALTLLSYSSAYRVTLRLQATPSPRWKTVSSTAVVGSSCYSTPFPEDAPEGRVVRDDQAAERYCLAQRRWLEIDCKRPSVHV